MNSIGKRVISLFPDFSLAQIGKVLNVSQDTVSSWKHNKSQPTFGTMEKVVSLRDCSWDWLITGEGKKNNSLIWVLENEREQLLAQIEEYQQKIDIEKSIVARKKIRLDRITEQITQLKN